MEMHELTTLWKDQDNELDKIIKVNKSLLKEISIQKVRSRLGHIQWSAIFSILVYLFNIYRLFLYYHINSYEPVVKTQKVLERLRYSDLLEKNFLYIAIPLFWIAFVIVAVKAVIFCSDTA